MTIFTEEDPLELESGVTLSPVEAAYETFGSLSANKDNAILICHPLYGDSHVARVENDPNAGWWDDLVGEGKYIDTSKYFVICPNILGGCKGTTGPSSINPSTQKPWGSQFPLITVKDMVNVQAKLVQELGISVLHSVIGPSMGGCLAMEWAVSRREEVKSVISIVACGRLHPLGMGYHHVMKQAIRQDPFFSKGDYYDEEGPKQGLAAAASLIEVICRSEEYMWDKFDRRYSGSLHKGHVFEIEHYLTFKSSHLVQNFDANSFLSYIEAMDLHDISRGFNSFEEALATIKSKILVASCPSDIAYPPYLQEEIVKGINQAGGDAKLIQIESAIGHDAFFSEITKIGPAIKDFLETI
jgi:homoserine O-acetyltransferase/O-succinyltransferase